VVENISLLCLDSVKVNLCTTIYFPASGIMVHRTNLIYRGKVNAASVRTILCQSDSPARQNASSQIGLGILRL